MMQQFKRFCLVGGFGFIVDSLCFLFLTYIIENIMLARLISFWFAASATWLGNRFYTYKQKRFSNAILQWCKHMLIVHLSGVINLLVFWSVKEICSISLAFCLGILAGLFSNYFFSKHFVFVSN